MHPHSFHLWEFHCIVKIADVIKQSEDWIILYIFKRSLNSHISVFISIKNLTHKRRRQLVMVAEFGVMNHLRLFFFSSFFVIDMLYEQTTVDSHSHILQLKCHMSFSAVTNAAVSTVHVDRNTHTQYSHIHRIFTSMYSQYCKNMFDFSSY